MKPAAPQLEKIQDLKRQALKMHLLGMSTRSISKALMAQGNPRTHAWVALAIKSLRAKV